MSRTTNTGWLRAVHNCEHSPTKIGGGRIHAEKSSYEVHLTGVSGEITIARFYNLDFEDVVRLYIEGDSGWDLEDRPWRIDVKATARDAMEIPQLLIPAKQELRAGLNVLAHRIEERIVRVIGMAPCSTVQVTKPQQYPGEKRNRVLEPNTSNSSRSENAWVNGPH